MTWADFYLICFAVGFCFSFVSFLFGGGRTGHLHLPHFHWHPGGTHPPAAHVVTSSTNGVVADRPVVHSGHGGDVSVFNLVTLTAFLAWFGGTGYLLTRFAAIWVGFGLLFSIGAGLAGGAIVFLFMTKVLMSREENMDSADYEMVGVLGRISVSIREGGTGEVIYSQVGTRRVCGARCEDGAAIAKGTEVVVTRYDKGIAYVRPWSEMSGDR